MMNQETARALATSWYRAATTPGTQLDVTMMVNSAGGWLARATGDPRPAQPLPMLRIGPDGSVAIMGGPSFRRN